METQLQEKNKIRISSLHPECFLIEDDGTLTKATDREFILVDYRITGILNYNNNCIHLAITVPSVNEHYVGFMNIISDFFTDLPTKSRLIASNEFTSDEPIAASELLFSKIIYLFTDTFLVDKEEVRKYFKSFGLILKIRDEEYWKEVETLERPSVFLCHDSRDKMPFVDDLYFALTRRFIQVWYDTRSLGYGESLSSKIQEGINVCRYAVVVLSKNFLSNKKWVEAELQTIFTKQIHSGETVLIPIWLDITEEDLKKEGLYWLLDKRAFKASDGTYLIADGIEGKLRGKIREEKKSAFKQ